MKKEQYPLDDHFRKALQNYSEASPDDSWENIESRIGKKNKKKFFIRWKYFVFTVLGLLLVSSYYVLENYSVLNSVILNNYDKNSVVESKADKNVVNKGESINDRIFSKEQPDVNNNKENRQLENSLNSDPGITPNRKSVPDEKLSSVNKSEVALSTIPIVIHSYKTKKEKKQFLKSDWDAQGAGIGMDSGYNNSPKRMASNFDGLDRTVNDVSDTIYFISGNYNLIDNTTDSYLKYDKSKKLPKLMPTEPAKRWALTGCYGSVRVSGDLKTEKSKYKNYVEMRNSTEEIQKSFSAGAQLEYHFSPEWYIQSGLRIISINRKANYNLTRSFYSLEDTTINGYIIDPFAPPQPFSYTYSHPVQKTEKFQLHSEFTLTKIRVPALIYYKKYFGKFNLNMGGGVVINIANLKKGEIVNPDLLVLTDFKTENDFVGDNTVDYFFSLQGEYVLDEQWSLFIEPAFSGGIVKGKSDVERIEKYIEINLGAKIKL